MAFSKKAIPKTLPATFATFATFKKKWRQNLFMAFSKKAIPKTLPAKPLTVFLESLPRFRS
jgi:hypothetical protein